MWRVGGREIKRLMPKNQCRAAKRLDPVIPLHFEIARLMLSLPSYVSFMYDLVTEEKRHFKATTAP